MMDNGEKRDGVSGEPDLDRSEKGGGEEAMRMRAAWSGLAGRLFGREEPRLSSGFTGRVMARVAAIAERERGGGRWRRSWLVPASALAACAAALFIAFGIYTGKPRVDLSTQALLVADANEGPGTAWVFDRAAPEPEILLVMMMEENNNEE